MTGAETLNAAAGPRPTFRGPLANQRPRLVVNFGPDPWLVLSVASLVGLGAVMVFNVSYFFGQTTTGDPMHFFRKHVISVGLGIVAAAITSRVPSERYRQLAYPLLAVAVALMLAVLIPGIGARRGGAQRWFPLGPLSFQPSEVAKFAVVLYLACSLVRKGERVKEFQFGVLPHCLVVGLVAGLSLLEPDFGTAALVIAILALMLLVGGARFRHLALLGSVALPGLAWVVIMEPYRLTRFLTFLDYTKDPQGLGFQLQQSLIAFGSGGVSGVGLGQSEQKMFFLPAAHTDFIFSVIGEEFGLVGACVVVLLFVVVGARGLRIAARHPDPFASLLAFGTTVLIVLQGVLNIGVVLGCLPTKGLALPFISYGGSAMMIVLGEVGVLLALAREAG
ncbi:MAG TPA: putative lipid II flippase FtsW [Candidatus Eisenbacteria bacterium]|nr:putative lipid II flippase FtsW [Candidatus Eisenbacteria bacterium]